MYCLVNHAFNLSRAFPNFSLFSRQWLEDAGSKTVRDGRSGLGHMCGQKTRNTATCGSASEKALPASTFTSPRAWAFALIGIHEYFRRLNGDRLFNTLRHELTDRLTEIFRKNSSSEWPWCEDIVTYTNAKIPHALILSGRWTDRQDALQIGLKALRWLVEIQTSPEGYFRAVGSNGFYQRNQEKAKFDQQPVEAYSMVSACIEAYRTTGDEYWFNAAKMAFEWFLGRNDLGAMVYNPETGGCRMLFMWTGVNTNEGGESTGVFAVIGRDEAIDAVVVKCIRCSEVFHKALIRLGIRV